VEKAKEERCGKKQNPQAVFFPDPFCSPMAKIFVGTEAQLLEEFVNPSKVGGGKPLTVSNLFG